MLRENAFSLLGLTQILDCAPSPLWVEGWDGWLHVLLKHKLMPTSPPSPQPSPACGRGRGRGRKSGFCVKP